MHPSIVLEFLEKNPRMFPNLKKGVVVADHNTGEKFQIKKGGAISLNKSASYGGAGGSEFSKLSVTSKKTAKDIN